LEVSVVKVNILGTDYEIKFLDEKEYPKLKMLDANGLAELYSKELIIDSKMDDGSGRAFSNLKEFEKKVLRHEIVHAFFHESGLTDYVNDEVLTDWLSIQIPKIMKVFESAGAL